jgi:succinyl-CoA synthetase beta subunit
MAAEGLPLPRGTVAATPDEARLAAISFGRPVVLKAQIRRGGRGKAGGVKLASDPEAAAEIAGALLGSTVRDEVVAEVLVVEAVSIERGLYLALAVDRAARAVSLIASASGGVDIEETSQTHPEAILRILVDPVYGLADYQCRELAFFLGLTGAHAAELAAITRRLYRTMVGRDATLVEINPLAVASDAGLTCLDAKIVIDDNALARHPDLASLRDDDGSDAERVARESGLSYVQLDGRVGCVVNGAGLAMATMDVVKLYGESPANFLDIGGGARAERVRTALDILLADPRVGVVLFNIFGGITRCDEVAKGIVAALADFKRQTPIVVRLVGTEDEVGRRILAEAGIGAYLEMDEAARAAVDCLGRSIPDHSIGANRSEVAP